MTSGCAWKVTGRNTFTVSDSWCVTSENSISEGTVLFIHTFYCLSICPLEWATYHASVFFPFNLKNYERKFNFLCPFMTGRVETVVIWIKNIFITTSWQVIIMSSLNTWILCLHVGSLRMGTFNINNYPRSDVLHTVAVFFHFYSILGLITHNINLRLSYLTQPVG